MSNDPNLRRTVNAMLDDKEKRIAELEAELKEDQQIFELQHKRMAEATAVWQQATGRKDVLPDLGDLLHWLVTSRGHFVKCSELQSADIKRAYRHVEQLEAILETVPHHLSQGLWVLHRDAQEPPCTSDCPKCAYERLNERDEKNEPERWYE